MKLVLVSFIAFTNEKIARGEKEGIVQVHVHVMMVYMYMYTDHHHPYCYTCTCTCIAVQVHVHVGRPKKDCENLVVL